MKSGNAIISVHQIKPLNKTNNSHNLLSNCLNIRAKWYNFQSLPCLREADHFLRLYRRFNVTTLPPQATDGSKTCMTEWLMEET